MFRIYSKSKCPYCLEAKEYFSSIGIEFEDINLSKKENRDARAYYRNLGVDTIPVIVCFPDTNNEMIFSGWDNGIKESIDVLIKRKH